MDRKLIEYLPSIMGEILEMKAIMAAEQPEIEKAWEATEAVLNDQFVATATQNGIKRWENLLKITPKATEALETRKFRIVTRLNEQLPYTMKTLNAQLESLCGEGGYTAVLQPQAYTLVVRVSVFGKGNFEEIRALLARIVPANLVVDISLKYNQNGALRQHTHSQLRRLTHDGIRKEVL